MPKSSISTKTGIGLRWGAKVVGHEGKAGHSQCPTIGGRKFDFRNLELGIEIPTGSVQEPGLL